MGLHIGQVIIANTKESNITVTLTVVMQSVIFYLAEQGFAEIIVMVYVYP